MRADLPAPFVRAVEKAINVNPVERFQTAGQLEEALDRAIANVSPAPTTPHLRSWWVVAASITAVSIIAIGLVSVTGPFDQAAGSRSPDDAAALTALTTRKLSPSDAVWPFSNPSDDGRFVAGRVNDTGDVAIINLLTGSYRALGMAQPDDPDGYASLGTLPGDGTAVAVDWHDKRGSSLRVIGTDGSAPRVLIGSASDVWVYQWSRDKSMILAVVEHDGEKTMALVAASDGAVRPLRRLDASVPLHMSLSPDSRYLAYDDPETPGAIERDIYVLDAHTGNQWPLGPSPGHDSAPFWTPDGRAVVFLSDRNRNASLWMVPVENGQPQRAPRLLKDDVGRMWLHGFTRYWRVALSALGRLCRGLPRQSGRNRIAAAAVAAAGGVEFLSYVVARRAVRGLRFRARSQWARTLGVRHVDGNRVAGGLGAAIRPAVGMGAGRFGDSGEWFQQRRDLCRRSRQRPRAGRGQRR